MKIKITNYPYQEFKIGDICDFGDEKNRSLVAMQRAVYLDNPPLILVKKPDILIPDEPVSSSPKPKVEETKTVSSSESPSEQKEVEPKKLIKNELREKVQQKKSAKDQSDSTDKKSFWDRLK